MSRFRLSAGAVSTAIFGLAFLAVACGAAKSAGPSTAVASASAADSVFVPSTGASPISLSFESGSCRVEVQSAVGASYRFNTSEATSVTSAIRQAISGCIKEKGSHGTMHVGATVAANGALSATTISPGGALSTSVAQCIEGAMSKAKLPSPEQGQSNELLLFVVSECKK